MSDKAETIQKVLNRGGNLQLPATAALLSKTALDLEEEGFSTAVFQTCAQKRPKTTSPHDKPAQSNWSKLEGTLQPPLASATTSTATDENWHEIPIARMTPELEKDLRVIENRQHLDPKRFYKASGSGRRKGELPQRVHVGRVVVGAHEFYSARLTRRERRGTVLEEVLSDDRVVQYTRNKFEMLQQARRGDKRVVDPAARAGRKRKRGSGDFGRV